MFKLEKKFKKIYILHKTNLIKLIKSKQLSFILYSELQKLITKL